MRGYDAGKKVKGRKRHIAVDFVHRAHISDSCGARLLMLRMHRVFNGLQCVFVDSGYKKGCIEWVQAMFRWPMEVVKRIGRGFEVLPTRWVVERTLAWLRFHRIHAKDYHHNSPHAEAAIYATSARITLIKSVNDKSLQPLINLDS